MSNAFPSGSREGYYSSDDILSLLKQKSTNVDYMSYFEAGSSLRNRNLGGLVITSAKNTTIPTTDRPTILIVSLLDAQTPLALMTSLYLINKLSETELPILSSTRLVVMPLVNADAWEKAEPGYVSRNKNMASTCSADADLDGVDLTRNYDVYWTTYSGNDTDAARMDHEDGCSNIYHGKRPNEEPETRAVLGALDKFKPKALLMLSQLPPVINNSSPFEARKTRIVSPYTYSPTLIPSPADQVAYKLLVESITNTTSAMDLYAGSGLSKLPYLRPGSLLDYAFDARGIFSLELVLSVGSHSASDSIWVASDQLISVISPHTDAIINLLSVIPQLPAKASRPGTSIGGKVANTIFFGPLLFGFVLLLMLGTVWAVARYVFQYDNLFVRFRNWWRRADRWLNRHRGFSRLGDKPPDDEELQDGFGFELDDGLLEEEDES
ncbi:hypothetical protein SmJEL517_g03863 [Synchytrium microbalum]|uniref:Peptidase M14 domain-containing protein n=1 Tax=Synchytrium microbalum TaxID=1806994 RepID=A0A507BWN5_9FUNG|nr:uncharacterized protein SmJEL517_g03863 [Synchytrium microbalum]TPX33237.1 hypothetical protein SmJEL517_g03863 [Synchytrium microbalum]